jgi:hypothetical protein
VVSVEVRLGACGEGQNEREAVWDRRTGRRASVSFMTMFNHRTARPILQSLLIYIQLSVLLYR